MIGTTLLILAGGFLFALAAGINFIYSTGGSCLDIYPPQCSTGYDRLPEFLHPFVKAGLYTVAAVLAAAGAALSLAARKSRRANPREYQTD
jgi:hypothetical protein